MKIFEDLWEEYEPNHKPYVLGIKPFIEGWFNRGAKEKEKEMMEFSCWFAAHCLCNDHTSTIKQAYDYWKNNVENKK